MQYPNTEPDFSDSLWQTSKPLIDSRNLFNPPQTVFFALKGSQRDGHEFVPQLYQNGVRNFVLSKPIELENARVWQVESPIMTLQNWAAFHRQTLNYPVLAIAGTKGKTIVKEWLYELLSPDYAIIKSPKSYNSQIGVPLSVLEAEARHEFGIFEAGISHPNEMQNLAKILQPDLGIFTNIGNTYGENFESIKRKTAEKMLLFKNVKKLVLCSDHQLVVEQAYELGIQTFSWGKNSADILLEQQVIYPNSCALKIHERGECHTIELPFNDWLSIENAMHCVALMRLLSVDYQTIGQRVINLRNLPMRLSLKDGGNCTLIDDSYNNDFQGLKLALEFLKQKAGLSPKTLIVSQVAGSHPKQVAQLIAAAGLSKVITVGEDFGKTVKPADFGCDAQFYGSTEELLNHLPNVEGFVLVKGSRNFGFEQIVRAYESKLHTTRLEINLSSIAHNFRVFRSFVPAKTRIMLMVKAFAYGSGSVEVAKLLEYLGVDYLAVAFADEGISLRKAGIKTPIMVMSSQPEQLENFVRFNLEPEVFNFQLLQAIIKKYPHLGFHLKINTGMNRLGFDESKNLKTLLNSNKNLKIKSVFSHLASSNNSQHKDFTLGQIGTFSRLVDELGLSATVIRHIANTEAITNFPQAAFDMVRLGIGLYGFSENQQIQRLLKTVSVLKTTIIQVRNIRAGQSVGYNRAFVAQSDCQIAVIAIGYADGFDRRNSLGKGKVLIKNKLVPVVGYVCMDMSFVEVSGLEVAEGDEVVVFGEEPSVLEIAKIWKTIPYEVLTHVNERVKRIYFED